MATVSPTGAWPVRISSTTSIASRSTRETVPAIELTMKASPRSGTIPIAQVPVPSSRRPTSSNVSAAKRFAEAATKLTQTTRLRVGSTPIAPAPGSASTVVTVSSVSRSITLIVEPSELPT